MADEIRVNAIELDGETVQIIYMQAPRMTEDGTPVTESRILTFNRDAEPVQAIVEDMADALTGYVTDLITALNDANTLSLDEYEATLEGDLDDDLGMGDD